MYNNEFSKFFTCGNGDRQGEIWYLFLFSLYLNDLELEIIKDFLYLGIEFSRSGWFSNAEKELLNRGTKAMYEVLKKRADFIIYL